VGRQLGPVLALVRFFGSRASSVRTSSSDNPIRCAGDERDASNHRAGIAPVPRVVAFRVNQTLFLVETQGRRRRAAALRNLANRQDAVHPGSLADFPLTSSAVEDRR
jgi:hypothetical protein